MSKRFNYTGTCIPEKHYMVDISNKIDQIMKLIENGEYFTINRPRQYGKSTTLYILAHSLRQKPGYVPIKTSFEDMGNTIFEDESLFCKTFTQKLAHAIEGFIPEISDFLRKESERLNNFLDLSGLITSFVKHEDKKIVLIIDEIDQTSNNDLFLKFLGVLRSKYLAQNEGDDYTFQSVILSSVHDVKLLKIKIRPDAQQKYNSPWNIAVDFPVDLSFSPPEISTMLTDYCRDKKVDMDIMGVSNQFYNYTSGYPFIVSKLCHIIDTQVMKNNKWNVSDVEEGIKIILEENNTNFQSLIKNLENNQGLYDLVYELTMNGEEKKFHIHNPLISLGYTYGIFKKKEGLLAVHNRVYEELIYNYMSSKIETSINMGGFNIRSQFIKKDNTLDFKKVILKFQEFMKEQYTTKEKKFLEENGRLIFLAFIKPIINNKGYDFKEVQISEEKRLDVVITYGTKKFITELKIWRGQKKHRAGVQQLAEYLDKQKSGKGYLVVFDFRQKKEWKQQHINEKGKDIFIVWV